MLSQIEIKSAGDVDATEERLRRMASSGAPNGLAPPISVNRYNYVMAVDDQSDIVKLIKRVLEKDEFKTCIFTDPFSALWHFNSSTQNHHHNIIISDIRMPEMNGYEFIKKIKKQDPNAKIILMSSLQIECNEFLNLLPEVKIDEFIQKPFSVFKLKNIVERMFR